jgi:hypothetical protein
VGGAGSTKEGRVHAWRASHVHGLSGGEDEATSTGTGTLFGGQRAVLT